MDGRVAFVSLAHGIMAGLSLYGVVNSYIAITKLQGYEATTKKLAKWSSVVETELHKTRTTQASGAIATTLSLACSLTLLLASRRLPVYLNYSVAPFMLLAVLFARGHIKNYWTPHRVTTTSTNADGTAKQKQKDVGVKLPALPNLEDYQLAQRKTEDLLLVLEYLEYAWLASCVVGGLVGYGS